MVCHGPTRLSSWSPVLHSVHLLLGRSSHGIRRRRSAQSLIPSICSVRLSPLIRLVGHPQSQMRVLGGFGPSLSIPLLLFPWFVRVVSPKVDPTFAEAGFGCCRDVELHTRIPFFSLLPLGGLDDGGRSGFLGRPLLRLDWLPATMT
ncbi:hypothetical protein U1Q18_015406 [Sarracenia purpurea var. burkii]